MRAAKKKLSVDSKVLQELVPLNALSAERFREVADKIVIEEVLAGRYLFRKGDRDNQSIYILEGKLNLIDGFRKVTSEVEACTDISRYPIANQQPRTLSARAVKKVVIARIDSSLLDAFLTWDQSSTAEAIEIGSESNEDWMTRILQSEAFIKIPPSMIQSLLMKMEQFPVKAGQTIISQNDEGDYFYTIHEGRCAVTRRESPEAEEVRLAELGSGDSFGEDALVSDARRNATVTMLTDGLLMRLAKRDFVELLKNQLVKRVDYAQASAMVDEGAVWIDVRTPDEYDGGAFEDSVNMPLATLRSELSELVFNSKYIICCDTGRRSESAAFLLSHKGFDVYVLEGGMDGLGGSPVQQDAVLKAEPDYDAVAELIELAIDDERHDAGASAVATDQAGVVVDRNAGHELLQVENAALLEQIDALHENERRLEEQLEQLRAELGEAGEKLAGLYEQTRSDAEQLELLRGELGESGEKLSGLYASQSAAGEEHDRLRQENASLQARLADKAAEFEQAIATLEAELEQGRAAQRAIAGELEAVSEAGRTTSEAQVEQLQQLADEKVVLSGRLQQVEQELATARAELESLPSTQQQAVRTNELETENTRLASELEQEQARVRELGETLQQAETRASEQQQTLEQELAELRSSIQGQEQVLAQASSGRDEAVSRIQVLEEENETLRTELRGHVVLLDEHREEVENLRADRVAAQEVVQHQQAEWETEREQLQQALASEREALAVLRETLADTESRAEQDRDDLAAELNARLAQANEKIEQLEVARVDLSRQNSAHGEELELAGQEHARLQQEIDELHSNNETLRTENEALQAGNEEHATTLAEQEGRMQAELESVQQRCTELETACSERDDELLRLRGELEVRSGESALVREECDLLHKQLSQSGEEIEQLKQHAAHLNAEHEEFERRTQEELERKTDNEKELQSQIDRLRKTMSQQSDDYRRGREEMLSDIENLREQLNLERRERDDERAEMAARQRELKEQLSLVATEHESNLSRQSGEIQQARDAVRQEEQERLREILTAQAETENLVDRLQAELKSAHEEITALTREQKDRRQTDAGLLEEQNQQVAATIESLETQLRQLTEERDAAIVEQRQLRDKLDSLRGEVEVARGLMNAAGQVEDPAQLRNELNESKKNVEIALRLRAEAEAARDRVIQERDRLQARLGSTDADSPPAGADDDVPTEAPLHVPSLDSGPAGAVHPGPGEALRPATLPVTPSEREQNKDAESLVDTQRDDRQRRWLGAAIGLGAVALCALAGWVFLGGPVLPEKEAVIPVTEVADALPQAPVSQQPPADVAATVVVDDPPAPAEEHAAVKEQAKPADTKEPEAEEKITPAEQETLEVAPAKPVRSFRDSLAGGGSGPMMVELPEGRFQMGSVGKSLNYDEVPRHEVTVAGFAISQHEVTFADYDRFARATGRRLPYDETWGRGNRPVINVSWSDAVAYARWLSDQTGANYRLPSEAEWEYAARAGTTGNFWWLDAGDTVWANCFNCGSQWDGVSTAPTGSFASNAFGLYDVSGNVQEWTADCYHGSYKGAPADASVWTTPGCEMRVVRGGAYTSPLDSLRSAKRSQYSQDARLDNLGFRVVRAN